MRMRQESDYRLILQGVLSERLRRNPRYSLRAFSRDLGLPVSTLSEILNRRYELTSRRAALVAEKLGLEPAEQKHFCGLVKGVERFETPQNLQEISLDAFNVISDWYHFALLELLCLKPAPKDLKSIARALDISVIVAKQAVQRLLRLGMLSEKKGVWIATHNHSKVGGRVPSNAVREFHRQVMARASIAMDRQELDTREIASMIFTIRKSEVGKAIQHLRKWRREFIKRFGDDQNPDEVYCLSLQFFSALQSRSTDGAAEC